MVALIRCNDIESDPRAMKYVKYLEDTGQQYILIGWDREGKMKDNEHARFFHQIAGYNVGGITAVVNRIKWMRFVIDTLRQLRLEKCVLHACDLDAAFPAIVYKKIFSKSRKLLILFDVFDWFSATLYSQSWIVLRAFKYMEKISVKNSDFIVICEPERIEQIPYEIQKNKLMVFPNIPFFSNSNFLRYDDNFRFDNNLLTFSYVGGFAPTRCINEIITVAEQGYINLAIAGFGDSQIEDRLSGLKSNKNIKYYGKVKYTDGLQIMYNSDIVYAMYSKVSPNNVYAAPNKYYEAMFLGKPLFSTRGTIVEKKVLSNHLGYISEETVEDIKGVISKITKENAAFLGENAKRLWNDTYSHYTYNWLKNDYQAIIDKY